MADLNNSLSNSKKGGLNPLVGLGLSALPLAFYALNLPKLPNTPILSGLGIDKSSIERLIRTSRQLGRSSIMRQAGLAAQAAAGALPSSLRQSTVPASIQANISASAADKIAKLEADLADRELSAKFKLFDALMSQAQFDLQKAQIESERSGDIFSTLAMIPLAFI